MSDILTDAEIADRKRDAQAAQEFLDVSLRDPFALRAIATIEALKEALEPFAVYAKHFLAKNERIPDEWSYRSLIPEAEALKEPCVGDMRRAADLLARMKGGGRMAELSADQKRALEIARNLIAASLPVPHGRDVCSIAAALLRERAVGIRVARPLGATELLEAAVRLEREAEELDRKRLSPQEWLESGSVELEGR